MKCPACQERAISFGDWGRGLNAFIHVCPHCGSQLRATRSTIILFILMVISIPGLIYLSECAADHFDIHRESQRRMIYASVLIPFALGISFVHWKTGCYRLAAKTSKNR